MADRARRSNVVMGDKRDQYNRGMWVSATRSVQTSVAEAGVRPEHSAKLKAERDRVARMKTALQTSSLVLGSSNHNETTWQSSNYQPPLSKKQQEAARGKLDEGVARRIKQSNVKLGCNRIQKVNYTSVSHSAHSDAAKVSAAERAADAAEAKKRKAALTNSSIDSW